MNGLVCILENYLKNNKKLYGEEACLGAYYEIKDEIRIPVKHLDDIPGSHTIYSLGRGVRFVSKSEDSPIYNTPIVNCYFVIKKNKTSWWRYLSWFLLACSIVTFIVCAVLIMAHTRNEEDILRPLKHTAESSYIYNILLYCILFVKYITHL